MDDAARPVQRFGKYDLVHELGHGGMAVVHRARYQGMGGFSRSVVIKTILPELASDESFVKMFVEEARLSALLDHPNIVQIHDFGTIDGSYFLAMEYIEGIPLHSFIRHFGRRRPVPAEAAAYIMQQVCVALDYAHQLTRDGKPLGIVHRDISPANVMLSVHGVVKLLDFGIAKAAEAIDREETRTGTLKGKWSYMSPERVVGQLVTARSDIFSAGIVLWELLTGRRLFKAKTDFLTLSNVVQAKVPPPTSLRGDLPAVLDQVCARALARKPKDRYTTAEQMADDLESLLNCRPFSPTLLAAMVAEAQAAATRDEEMDNTADDSAASVPAPALVTHASSHLPAPDLLQRRPWLLPTAIIAAALALSAAVLVYLLVPGPVLETPEDPHRGRGTTTDRPLNAADRSAPAPRRDGGASAPDVDSTTRPARPDTTRPAQSQRDSAPATLPTDTVVPLRKPSKKPGVGKKPPTKPAIDSTASQEGSRTPAVVAPEKNGAKPKRAPEKKELPNLRSGDLADDPSR